MFQVIVYLPNGNPATSKPLRGSDALYYASRMRDIYPNALFGLRTFSLPA